MHGISVLSGVSRYLFTTPLESSHRVFICLLRCCPGSELLGAHLVYYRVNCLWILGNPKEEPQSLERQHRTRFGTQESGSVAISQLWSLCLEFPCAAGCPRPNGFIPFLVSFSHQLDTAQSHLRKSLLGDCFLGHFPPQY